MSNNPQDLVNDSELWRRVIDGEKDILEVFYNKYYNLLLNYGLKIYSDEDFIKDCIQDLFVKLYKSSFLKPTPYVRSYLLKAMKNIIHDKAVDKSNKISIEDNFSDPGITDSELDQLFEKDDAELKLSKQLLNIYQGLPKNQKMVIYLRYIKGFSYNEISEIMEIAPQSSMNLVSRALSNIRKHMINVLLFFL